MRIILVHCPVKHQVFSENLRVVDEEFCLAPPIILAYVASILEQAGHKVALLDVHALKLSKEATLQSIKNFSPDVIGFRMDTYQFHQTLGWIKYFKQNINVPVVAGGINFSLYPEESLLHPEIDYGVIGEAVGTLPKLLIAMENGESLDAIDGIVYRENGLIKLNPPLQKVIDFDSYPFPARHLLPNKKYHSIISQRKNFTIMVTSRGCPYKCLFCAIAKLAYSERSPANVVDEIEQCYREYDIREIDFFDAVFFLNKDRSLEIFRQLIKRKIRIEWSCRSRVDVVDEELLKMASIAGCRQIYYGIESADPEVLKNIKKTVSLEQVQRAIKLSRKYGIQTLGFFMIGNPGETRDAAKKTINLMRQLNLDFIQVCRTIAKPGSELEETLKIATGRDYWREYIISGNNGRRLPTPWMDLNQKEIENYIKEAYYKFYFRPIYIFKTFLKVKSFRELWRYFRVGLKMIFSNLSTDINR